MRARITIITFLCALAVASILVFVVPADEESILSENRTVTPFPHFSAATFFDGSFSRDLEDYIADNVGFRSFFTSNSSSFSAALGLDLGLGKVIEVNKDLGGGETGEKNRLLLLEDRVEETFRFQKESADLYIDMLNHYAQKLPEHINLYSMLIPTQIEFEAPIYKSLSTSQKDAISYVSGGVQDRVQCVDAYSMLQEHKDEYVYFRTDHHWTQLGAFYAYNAFLKATGEEEAVLSDYTEKTFDGFYGTLYKQAGEPEELAPDSITIYQKGTNLPTKAFGYLEDGSPVEYGGVLFNEPAPEEQAAYRIFLCGDHALLHIPTETKNSKSILIIKDSYANAFAPWLVSNYEHIIMIDPRSYKEPLDAVLEQYEIDDVLILNYCLTTTFPDFIEAMKTLY